MLLHTLPYYAHGGRVSGNGFRLFVLPIPPSKSSSFATTRPQDNKTKAPDLSF